MLYVARAETKASSCTSSKHEEKQDQRGIDDALATVDMRRMKKQLMIADVEGNGRFARVVGR